MHKIVSVPGDVRDESLLKNLFENHKPAWVLHAAAHKHVALMEGRHLYTGEDRRGLQCGALPVHLYGQGRAAYQLNGLVPEKDIEIKFTGLKAGEKMYEELFRDGDIRKDTGHMRTLQIVRYFVKYSYDSQALLGKSYKVFMGESAYCLAVRGAPLW